MDTISKSVNQLDLIGQYIGNVLQRLNYANELSNARRYFDALIALKPTIRILYAIKQDDAGFNKILDKWINRIDEISQISNIGSTKARSVFQTQFEKNNRAAPIYEEIETEIWQILGKEGFFTFQNGMQFWDPSAGQKSGDGKYNRPPLPTELSSRAVKSNPSS